MRKNLLTSLRNILKLSLSYCTTMSGDKNYSVVFILGCPGSGKGTQCDKISKAFDYTHLSAGELLRKAGNDPNSPEGKLINYHIAAGTIVPVRITCSLLEKEMMYRGNDKYLIDGFPRNQDNLDGWIANMSEKVCLRFVLYLDCPDEACTQRCLARGRCDDNKETLAYRLIQFKNECQPIIDHFDRLNLVRRIDASKSSNEVFESIKEYFIQ